MTTTAYDTIRTLAQELTPEERAKLRSELAVMDLTDPPGSGAAIVEFLRTSEPLDRSGLDEMERAIEEGCEQVDLRDW